MTRRWSAVPVHAPSSTGAGTPAAAWMASIARPKALPGKRKSTAATLPWRVASSWFSQRCMPRLPMTTVTGAMASAGQLSASVAANLPTSRSALVSRYAQRVIAGTVANGRLSG